MLKIYAENVVQLCVLRKALLFLKSEYKANLPTLLCKVNVKSFSKEKIDCFI